MRNVVPRQGTETLALTSKKSGYLNEKCSSPTGDGNLVSSFVSSLFKNEKCSSPTGDGNLLKVSLMDKISLT